MSIDLASVHLRLWRLHLGIDVEIEDAPDREPPEVMGYTAGVETLGLEDGDGTEGMRLGF